MFIVTDDCVGCEQCLDHCALDAIVVEDGKATIDQVQCVSCGLCAETCPMYAIDVE